MLFFSWKVTKFWQCLRAVLLAQLAAVLLAASGIATAADDDFLPPEQAFRFAVTMVDGQTAEVRFDIAPGYYLYRERFAFDAGQARLGQPAFPAGDRHVDETFQKEMETYRGVFKVRIPVDGNGRFTLTTTSQGCSDKGLCYPPMSSTAVLAAGGPAGSSSTAAAPESALANDGDSGRIDDGASSGTLLPRAGAWMVGVRRFFGVLMLGTALWIAAPVLPSRALILGWGLLGLGHAVSLLLPRPRRPFAMAAGLAAGVLGLTQLAGLAAGGSDPLAPFATAEAHGETPFRRVRSVAELDAILASSPGKTVMLDFYADWCVSCKEIERFTFSDPRVQTRFAQMLLLQADVTANNAADQALLKRFGLFGPPGIIFFGADGRELGGSRVIGYEDADAFHASLRKAEAAQTAPILDHYLVYRS